MTSLASSRFLRVALFVLVPAAYVSMVIWRPANAYGPAGRQGISEFLDVFMAAVFLVSLLSWSQHRLVASLGLIACILWLAVLLLPVL